MSIYRTIRSQEECPICHGEGNLGEGSDGEIRTCTTCKGTGQVSVVRRASQKAIASAKAAERKLPRAQRGRFREVRPDTENTVAPPDNSRVGSGFIDEDDL